MTTESIKPGDYYNNADGSLPFGYYNPMTEGKLCWICGNDAEGKITSVFVYDHGTHKEKKAQYIKDMDEARYFRDELLKDGWRELDPPEITFTRPGEDKERKLNRKERRFLKRKLERANRKNPFDKQ